MLKKSETFCPLPFMAIDAVANTFSPCCYIDKKHFQEYKTIEEYYQSKELSELQNNLTKGIKDSKCTRCWKNEETGIQSMRQGVLQDNDRIIHENKIQQVSLHVGKTCNLACMMCWPSTSSTWDKLWKGENPWKIETRGRENYDEYIEDYIKKNLKAIRYIEIQGGEPFFSKRFFSLLEWIVEHNQAKNITLFIITNLTILPPNMIKILKNFKKVVLTVSLEGVGLVNDYIRWGSDFNKIDANIKEGRKNNFDVGITSTISSLNIHRFHEIYEYADSLKVPVVNVIPVRSWSSLLPCNLPEYLHQRVDNRFKNLLEGNNDGQTLRNFINKWDKQRNTSILKYMPEFEEFLKNA